MDNRYVKSDEKKEIFFIDANSLYGYAMSEYVPYDEIQMWQGYPDLYVDKLEDDLITEDNRVFGYFVEVDFKYPDNTKQKTNMKI